MHMSVSVRISLLVLGCYLVAMVALVGYRVLELSAVLHAQTLNSEPNNAQRPFG